MAPGALRNLLELLTLSGCTKIPAHAAPNSCHGTDRSALHMDFHNSSPIQNFRIRILGRCILFLTSLCRCWHYVPVWAWLFPFGLQVCGFGVLIAAARSPEIRLSPAAFSNYTPHPWRTLIKLRPLSEHTTPQPNHPTSLHTQCAPVYRIARPSR